MARARNIKPGFFKNEILAELSFEQRLLFIGLWTLADREGRLEDRPRRIKAELFAFDSIDVEPMLERLQADGFVIRYEANGKAYIHITNFVKHQDPHYKEKASEIPPPPGYENEVKATNVTRTQRARILERDGEKCVQCGATDHLSIDHIVPVSRGGDSSDDNLQVLCLRCNTGKSNKLDGEERARKRTKQGVFPGTVFDPIQVRSDVASTLNHGQVDASASSPLTPDSGFSDPLHSDSYVPPSAASADAEKPSRKKQKTQLPKDFAPDATGVDLCRQAGLNLAEELGKFRNHHEAQGTVMANWQAGFRTWIDKAKSFRKPWQQPASVTVPGTPGRDPALVKLDEDAKRTAPLPDNLRAHFAGVTQQLKVKH